MNGTAAVTVRRRRESAHLTAASVGSLTSLQGPCTDVPAGR